MTQYGCHLIKAMLEMKNMENSLPSHEVYDLSEEETHGNKIRYRMDPKKRNDKPMLQLAEMENAVV